MKELYRKLKNRLINDKSLLLILLIYSLFCLTSGIYFIVVSHIRNMLMSFLFLLFVPLLFIVEKLFKLKIVPLFALLIYFIAAGSILGTCFEFYTIFPYFDIILHGISGFIFGCLGFSLMELLVGKANNAKRFLACLLFGVAFSLAIAVLWEIFEYCATLIGIDMMEDTIINSFDSYLLAGNHSEVVTIDGITKTIIYYKNGQTLEINGYLDIGLLDTLHDMIICVIGSIVFTFIVSISYKKYPKINEALIPNLSVQNSN